MPVRDEGFAVPAPSAYKKPLLPAPSGPFTKRETRNEKEKIALSSSPSVARGEKSSCTYENERPAHRPKAPCIIAFVN